MIAEKFILGGILQNFITIAGSNTIAILSWPGSPFSSKSLCLYRNRYSRKVFSIGFNSNGSPENSNAYDIMQILKIMEWMIEK